MFNVWGHKPLSKSIVLSSVLLFSVPLPIVAQEPSVLLRPATFRSGYILGPGDQIEITVFGYEEYTGSKVILSDGTIALPIIGSVEAAQRTPEQLAQELRDRLQLLLIDPVVTVSLNTLRPVVVNVAGEVQRPGPVELRGLSTAGNANSGTPLNGAPTVSSALIQAGGITQRADIREVVIRRSLPNNHFETLTVNLWDTLWSEQVSQDLVLQDGDSILVPQLAADETLDRRLIARSSLSPNTVRVRVVGEVTRPGEVQVPPDSSISSAVAIAGGPTADARLSRVGFVRMNELGQIERQVLNLSNLTDTHQVQDGDVIIVPKRNSSSVLDFAGRLFSPLGILFDLLNDITGR